MARIRGNDLKLFIGSTQGTEVWLDCENGFDFNVSASEIDASCKTDGDYAFTLPGLKDGEIPFNQRFDTEGTMGYVELLAFFNANTEVFFRITTDEVGDMLITGSARVLGLNISAQTNQAADVSGTLKISGAPTVGTVAA